MDAYKNLSLEDMEGEIWKDIEDYEGYYQISNFGRVKSLSRTVNNRNFFFTIKERIMRFSNYGVGYLTVTLSVNKKRTTIIVHRLVAKHFVDNPRNKPQVNHIDNIKTNNLKDNLEWVSQSENQCHRFINKETSSNYRGVKFCKLQTVNPWRSTIKIDKKNISLGNYKTREEAYEARCNYEKENNIENKYL